MRSYAAIVMLVTVSAGLVRAAEPKTPEVLIGRWAAVKMQAEGKAVSLEEIRVEFEFTPEQLRMRMNTPGEALAPVPMHVFDCSFSTADSRKVIELKTASDSPGPETGLHHRGTFEVAGDTLRICFGHSDDPKRPAELPKDFVSLPENRNDLLILRRVQSDR